MPHLRLEYTGNIEQEVDFDHLLASLHSILASVAGVSVDNCKSRAIRLDAYRAGSGGEDQAFVHLSVRMFEGRPLEVRQEVGRQALGALETAYAPSLASLDLQITVEVAEIERATYFKSPAGAPGSGGGPA